MKRKYLALLIVSAALIAPGCSKPHTQAMVVSGAIVTGMTAGLHFLSNKLGITSKKANPGANAESRANKFPKRDLLNTVK